MQIPKINFFDKNKIKFSKIPALLENYSFWIIAIIVVLIIGGEWGFFQFSKQRIKNADKNPQGQMININQEGMDKMQNYKKNREEKYLAVDQNNVVNPFFLVSPQADNKANNSGVKAE